MTLSGSLINLLSEAHLKNAEIFLQPIYEEVVSSGVAAIWYLGRRGTVVFVSIAPPCYSPDSATLCDQLKDDEGPSDVFLGGQPNKKTKVRSQHHFEKILSFVSRLRSRRSDPVEGGAHAWICRSQHCRACGAEAADGGLVA